MSDPSIIVIWDEKTETKPYGWIFFPTTRKYAETGNPNFLTPGLSPIIINKFDSTLTVVPSSVALSVFLKEFEKQFK